MGEVYRALDTNLGRDVAIKALPGALTADTDRLERFEREARLLAALNHPNVAQIYGFEKADAIRVLVMELVEGPTLLDRIAKGPIPVREALSIAKQVAEALDAAHEKGIIHRDLKPANVKVRKDGTVKVLDLGLAKAIGGDASAAALSHSPTITAAGTRAGVVLGTPAYMSPEQARGQPVDKRTDIWAFGCVLYEMLTGRPVFARDTVSHTIAAILEREPDWQLPAGAGSVRGLLQRCLEKDPKSRLRDIGDAMALVAEEAPAADPLPQSRARERWLMLIATTAVVGLAALAGWMFSRSAPQAAEPIRFSIPPPDGQRLAPGGAPAGALAVSPDGRQIAFEAGLSADTSSLWIRSLDTLAARPLPGTEGAFQPFWSPDGRHLGFVLTGAGGPGKLQRIAVTGGPPQELADTGPGRAAWSSLGIIVFQGTDRRLHRVSDTGGQTTPVTELDKARQETSHSYPVFLPDGRRFIFLARSRNVANNALFLSSLDSPQRTHLVNSSAHCTVSPGSQTMHQHFPSRYATRKCTVWPRTRLQMTASAMIRGFQDILRRARLAR